MSYKPGDKIFAKVKGYPHWPCRINPLPPDVSIPKGKVPIFFYGTHEVYFILKKDIQPYEQNKEKYAIKNNRLQFQDGLSEIENNPTILMYGIDPKAEEFLIQFYKFERKDTTVQADSNDKKHPQSDEEDIPLSLLSRSLASPSNDKSEQSEKHEILKVSDEKEKPIKKRRISLTQENHLEKRPKTLSENSTMDSEHNQPDPKIEPKTDIFLNATQIDKIDVDPTELIKDDQDEVVKKNKDKLTVSNRKSTESNAQQEEKVKNDKINQEKLPLENGQRSVNSLDNLTDSPQLEESLLKVKKQRKSATKLSKKPAIDSDAESLTQSQVNLKADSSLENQEALETASKKLTALGRPMRKSASNFNARKLIESGCFPEEEPEDDKDWRPKSVSDSPSFPSSPPFPKSLEIRKPKSTAIVMPLQRKSEPNLQEDRPNELESEPKQKKKNDLEKFDKSTKSDHTKDEDSSSDSECIIKRPSKRYSEEHKKFSNNETHFKRARKIEPVIDLAVAVQNAKETNATRRSEYEKENATKKSSTEDDLRELDNEARLMLLDRAIKTSLVQGSEDINACLVHLGSLLTLDVSLVTIAKCYSIVITLKKCRRYNRSLEVRIGAQKAFNHLLHFYTSAPKTLIDEAHGELKLKRLTYQKMIASQPRTKLQSPPTSMAELFHFTQATNQLSSIPSSNSSSSATITQETKCSLPEHTEQHVSDNLLEKSNLSSKSNIPELSDNLSNSKINSHLYAYAEKAIRREQEIRQAQQILVTRSSPEQPQEEITSNIPEETIESSSPPEETTSSPENDTNHKDLEKKIFGSSDDSMDGQEFAVFKKVSNPPIVEERNEVITVVQDEAQEPLLDQSLPREDQVKVTEQEDEVLNDTKSEGEASSVSNLESPFEEVEDDSNMNIHHEHAARNKSMNRPARQPSPHALPHPLEHYQKFMKSALNPSDNCDKDVPKALNVEAKRDYPRLFSLPNESSGLSGLIERNIVQENVKKSLGESFNQDENEELFDLDSRIANILASAQKFDAAMTSMQHNRQRFASENLEESLDIPEPFTGGRELDVLPPPPPPPKLFMGSSKNLILAAKPTGTISRLPGEDFSKPVAPNIQPLHLDDCPASPDIQQKPKDISTMLGLLP